MATPTKPRKTVRVGVGIKVKTKAQGKVTLKGFGPNKYAWFKIGRAAVEILKKRLDKGEGSDGQPMPPLSVKTSAVRGEDGQFLRQRRGYADAKARRGLKPIRDLIGRGVGGHLRDGIRVTVATDHSVTIAITSRIARIKAMANERRAPWFGFSPDDAQQIADMVKAVVDGNVRSEK